MCLTADLDFVFRDIYGNVLLISISWHNIDYVLHLMHIKQKSKTVPKMDSRGLKRRNLRNSKILRNSDYFFLSSKIQGI